MKITNDFISEKIKAIQTRRESLVAELNALAGAEQAYKEMLAELEKGEQYESDTDKDSGSVSDPDLKSENHVRKSKR